MSTDLNLEQIYDALTQRRAAKNLEGTLIYCWRRQPKEQWQLTRRRIWQRDHGQCQSPSDAPPKLHQLCKETLSLKECHIDHIVPLSKGGSNHALNLRTLCPICHALRLDRNHQGMPLSLVKTGLLPVDWKAFVWE